MKYDEIKRNQDKVPDTDYSGYTKEKLIYWIQESDTQNRKDIMYYRCKVDDLENSLTHNKEITLQLIERNNELEDELLKLQRERKEIKEEAYHHKHDNEQIILTLHNTQHELSQALREIQRLELQIDDDSQKIDTQEYNLKTLMDQLESQKQTVAKLTSQLEKEKTERIAHEKTLESMSNELRELKEYQRLNADSDTTFDAIQSLSMIILSKERMASVDSNIRNLVQIVFGENGSKVLRIYEKKLSLLRHEKKEIRDKVRSEVAVSMKALKELGEAYDLIVELSELIEFGEAENIARSLQDRKEIIIQKKVTLTQAVQQARSALNFAARDSLKDRTDSGNLVFSTPPDDSKQRSRSKDSTESSYLKSEDVLPPLRPAHKITTTKHPGNSSIYSPQSSIKDSFKSAGLPSKASLATSKDSIRDGGNITGKGMINSEDLYAYLYCTSIAVEELLKETLISGSLLNDSSSDSIG